MPAGNVEYGRNEEVGSISGCTGAFQYGFAYAPGAPHFDGTTVPYDGNDDEDEPVVPEAT